TVTTCAEVGSSVTVADGSAVAAVDDGSSPARSSGPSGAVTSRTTSTPMRIASTTTSVISSGPRRRDDMGGLPLLRGEHALRYATGLRTRQSKIGPCVRVRL